MAKDYDSRSDSLYLYITDEYEYNESVEIDNDVILDFDKNLVPVAIEFLGASKLLGVSKFSIMNLRTLTMQIYTNEKIISIKACFTVPFHQKEIKSPIEVTTTNDINIPHMQSSFEVTIA